jgi:2,4-dichlorophenol 6-monooxygenase
VQDAHNLAWKLAAVMTGSAAPALLDTYESERRPVAQYNADQSLRNAMRMFEVFHALGFGQDADASRRSFAATLADATRRRELVVAIEHQAEHFDMLGLQLGFVYDHGALVSDDIVDPVPANPVREFVPTSRPGARLPHGWVEREGHRVSTLDLLPLDRSTILVGPEGAEWIEAARVLTPSLHCVHVGRDVTDPNDWWTTTARMPPDGVLLVRPDQHIAFRSRGRMGEPRTLIARALASVLCREVPRS